MPYRSNEDLPIAVQAHLPPHAQDISEAFNHAFASHPVIHARKKRRIALHGRRSSGPI